MRQLVSVCDLNPMFSELLGLTGGMEKLAGHAFSKCLLYIKTRHGVWRAGRNDTARAL